MTRLLMLMLATIVLAAGSATAGMTANSGGASATFTDPDFDSFESATSTDVLGLGEWYFRYNGSTVSLSPSDITSEVGDGTNALSIGFTVGAPGNQISGTMIALLSEPANPEIQARLVLGVDVVNELGTPIDLGIFFVADINVGPNFDFDEAQAILVGESFTGIVEITNAVNNDFLVETVAESFVNYQVDTYTSIVTSILAGSNLNNTGLPGGPGDLSVAYEWQYNNVASSDSRQVGAQIEIQNAPPPPIPEPATAGLLGLAALALLRRRQR